MFSSFELDALKEVGNIGAGNAATALSTLLSKTIKINVPNASLMPFDDVPKTVGGHEKVVAGIFMRFTGDIDGNILIIIDESDLKAILGLLLVERENFGRSVCNGGFCFSRTGKYCS